MRRHPNTIIVLLFIIFLLSSVIVFSQTSIRDYEDVSKTLKRLNSEYPSITRLLHLAKTTGQKDIWVLEVGQGDVDNHPGLAIVSGVDGSYISGPELTLRFAEKLLISSALDSIKNLIDSLTFYIIPNVSPDATEQYFSSLKYDRRKNARATDDDRDGRLDEDPYEDMNRDGYITTIRVKDPGGTWIKHPDDERVMVMADKNEGEKGEYILISEGIDNDLDKKFNEDGEGGIIFNKNLPFKFEHFKSGAGDYPVSEVETKAVLDYLYEKWNIFSVFTFGPSDNLSVPQQYVKNDTQQQIITGILEPDAIINTFVSLKYNELTGKKNNTEQVSSNGGFMQWAYFHFGRLSYSTPAFFIPKAKNHADTSNTNNKNIKYNAEVNFLRWADSVLQKDYFLEWTLMDHPDFPGRQVEIGGLFPYVRNNPPSTILDSISDTHNDFIIWLATQRPVIELLNLQTDNLGKDFYRIELDVYNKGLFPALSGIGEKTRWVKKPKISLKLQDGQEVVSGPLVQLLDSLPGDSKHHLKWLVKEKGTIKIEVGAPQTGIKIVEVDLK